jgi:hypothetical protein
MRKFQNTSSVSSRFVSSSWSVCMVESCGRVREAVHRHVIRVNLQAAHIVPLFRNQQKSKVSFLLHDTSSESEQANGLYNTIIEFFKPVFCTVFFTIRMWMLLHLMGIQCSQCHAESLCPLWGYKGLIFKKKTFTPAPAPSHSFFHCWKWRETE